MEHDRYIQNHKRATGRGDRPLWQPSVSLKALLSVRQTSQLQAPGPSGREGSERSQPPSGQTDEELKAPQVACSP